MNEKLFYDQENEPGRKYDQGQQTVMMFIKTMVQGIGSNTESKPDHGCFKSRIMNDIDAKQRETAEKQWKESTMNGTGCRCGNAESVPVYFVFHKSFQRYKKAT